VRYCLAEAGVLGHRNAVQAVAFYDKPLLKFHRILETSLAVAPRGLRPFLRALPVWMREKLWIDADIRSALHACGIDAPEHIHYTEHHEAHAASAFFASPFSSAAVLTLDGVGEWATATLGIGQGASLELLQSLDFPHSLGLLYSAFTYFCGFRVNAGEYKLMGLAPYGQPRYVGAILEHLVDLRPDGSFRLAMPYFGYLDGLVMTSPRFAALFGGPPRRPEGPITRREMDLARSIQDVTETIVLRMARHARQVTGQRHLCLAGGVALNCVANGKLLREGIFDDLWIQPAAGDAGGAIGAALAVWHGELQGPRETDGVHDAMQGGYLGPEFDDATTEAWLQRLGLPYRLLTDTTFASEVAQLLADQKIVALVQGRMEFGPRALGNRSIVGDARSVRMQSVMNLKVKFRESFRPFAPSVLLERTADYFALDRPSPYMLLVADVLPARRLPDVGDEVDLDVMERVHRPRSDVPAVTHVDHSARIHTVSRETNPRYHALLTAFEALTGCGLLVNTSFNVRGEPIVCTPEDGYRCFMRSDIDALALGNCLLLKGEQPPWREAIPWREGLALD
jgi:carbamoyltransferase